MPSTRGIRARSAIGPFVAVLLAMQNSCGTEVVDTEELGQANVEVQLGVVLPDHAENEPWQLHLQIEPAGIEQWFAFDSQLGSFSTSFARLPAGEHEFIATLLEGETVRGRGSATAKVEAHKTASLLILIIVNDNGGSEPEPDPEDVFRFTGKLTADNWPHPSHFGAALDLDGKTLVVADSSDLRRGWDQRGVVYVYEDTNHGLQLQNRLFTTETRGSNEFGFDLALEGDVLAILDSRVVRHNPGQSDESTVQIYTKQNGKWVLEQIVPANMRSKLHLSGNVLAITHTFLSTKDRVVVYRRNPDGTANTGDPRWKPDNEGISKIVRCPPSSTILPAPDNYIHASILGAQLLGDWLVVFYDEVDCRTGWIVFDPNRKRERFVRLYHFRGDDWVFVEESKGDGSRYQEFVEKANAEKASRPDIGAFRACDFDPDAFDNSHLFAFGTALAFNDNMLAVGAHYANPRYIGNGGPGTVYIYEPRADSTTCQPSQPPTNLVADPQLLGGQVLSAGAECDIDGDGTATATCEVVAKDGHVVRFILNWSDGSSYSDNVGFPAPAEMVFNASNGCGETGKIERVMQRGGTVIFDWHLDPSSQFLANKVECPVIFEAEASADSTRRGTFTINISAADK